MPLLTQCLLRFLRLFPLFTELEQDLGRTEDQVQAVSTEWKTYCDRKQAEYALNEEDLVSRLDLAGHARIKAEDDARFWKARAEAAEAAYKESDKETKQALMKIANFEAIRGGSLAIPFAEVFVPLPLNPDEGDYEEGHQARPMTPRARQLEAVNKSRREASERRKKFRESLNLGEVTESALNGNEV